MHNSISCIVDVDVGHSPPQHYDFDFCYDPDKDRI